MSGSNIFQDTVWMLKEFLKVFYSPISVAGGVIDAIRGWRFSRSWFRVWVNLPSIVLLAAVYLIFGFSFFTREDSQIQLFSVEDEKRCPTQILEAKCNQMQEDDFCKGIGLADAKRHDYKTTPISEPTLRYVELLCKRILSIQPYNPVAHYRLGMVHNVMGQAETAFSEMTDLAKGKYGDYPPANAWLAKELINQRVAGKEVSSKELVSNLENASKWKEVDYRLVSFYAQKLEQSRETAKAISVARRAAAINPDLHLELARLFSRLGYNEELRSAANTVEEIFIKRLNIPGEKESDRLAVVEARRMVNRLDQAAELLTAGLKNSNSSVFKRELSEIQLLMYRKSVFKTELGEDRADLSLLLKAADSDPLNPNISTEIAGLQSLKIRNSEEKGQEEKELMKKLVAVLRQQRELGISSASAHILIAEGLFTDGNINGAIKNLELALIRDPKNIGVMNNLAFCLAKESDSNVPRSLELLNRALALTPGNAEVIDTFGDVLLIAKRYKEAIAKFELAIRFDNSRNNTREKLVRTFRLIGMDADADATAKVIKQIEQSKSDAEAKEKASGK